ncbi:MAG TPA: O-acetyl-ADP-ribose deacetylase [Nitrososphaerales archaeon]|nr:O-acetyl-ADP-ribose deacetylase [Nitrososphaerales archaeon]
MIRWSAARGQVRMTATWGKTTVNMVLGDITDQAVDAVVNAANPSLLGGGGVDGAIHRKGGPAILEECRRIRQKEWPNGLPTGKAVITTGGSLKARRVIHTVGPVWSGGRGGESASLAECYESSLRIAVQHGLRSVAFPSIGTGAYGYPIGEASRIALKAVKSFAEREGAPEEVTFVLYSENDFKVYLEALGELR